MNAAAQMIRVRFGLKATFDYLVGEKLTKFVSAASRHPDFARELPRFISEARRMFTLDEILVHLAQTGHEKKKQIWSMLEEDDPFVRVRLQPWNTPTVHDAGVLTIGPR